MNHDLTPTEEDLEFQRVIKEYEELKEISELDKLFKFDLFIVLGFLNLYTDDDCFELSAWLED